MSGGDDDEELLVGEDQRATRSSEVEACFGNSQAMWDYSEAGLERHSTLRGYLGDFRTTLSQYRDTASFAVADGAEVEWDLGRTDDRAVEDTVEDLVTDWEHLDRFVGQVGTAFYKAENSEDPSTDVDPDQVFHHTVGDLFEHGEIGFAARDDARSEAERLAGELESLEGASVGEFEAWLAQVERGQYDTEFAVAFAETLGVDGFETAPELVEGIYGDDFADGYVQAIDVLGVTLFTALDTDLNDEGGYMYPEHADLAMEDRIDPGFLVDLRESLEARLPDDPDADLPENPEGMAQYLGAGYELAARLEESRRVTEEVESLASSESTGTTDGETTATTTGTDSRSAENAAAEVPRPATSSTSVPTGPTPTNVRAAGPGFTARDAGPTVRADSSWSQEGGITGRSLTPEYGASRRSWSPRGDEPWLPENLPRSGAVEGITVPDTTTGGDCRSSSPENEVESVVDSDEPEADTTGEKDCRPEDADSEERGEPEGRDGGREDRADPDRPRRSWVGADPGGDRPRTLIAADDGQGLAADVRAEESGVAGEGRGPGSGGGDGEDESRVREIRRTVVERVDGATQGSLVSGASAEGSPGGFGGRISGVGGSIAEGATAAFEGGGDGDGNGPEVLQASVGAEGQPTSDGPAERINRVRTSLWEDIRGRASAGDGGEQT